MNIVDGVMECGFCAIAALTSICRVQYVQNIENMWCAVHTVLNSVLVLAGGVRDMVLVVIN